jgi:hypothetical protein
MFSNTLLLRCRIISSKLLTKATLFKSFNSLFHLSHPKYLISSNDSSLRKVTHHNRNNIGFQSFYSTHNSKEYPKNDKNQPKNDQSSSESTIDPSTNSSIKLPSIQPRLMIGYTCKVCNTRNHKFMSKKAYETGVVIIQCDGCKSRHLIADHLGWFEHSRPAGTLEDILKEKGESVVRLRMQDVLSEAAALSSSSSPTSSSSRAPSEEDGASNVGVEGEKIDEKVFEGLMEWLPKTADSVYSKAIKK